METEEQQVNQKNVQDTIADKFKQNDSLKLCLSNIGRWVKKQDVMEFLDTNNIKYKNVQKEKNKVFGFVLFDTVDDKETAHQQLEKLEYKGNKLNIGEAIARQPKNKRRIDSNNEKSGSSKRLCNENSSISPLENENTLMNNNNDDDENILECRNVLEATAPWYDKTYEEQLSLKEQEMKGVLIRCARKLRKRIDKQLGLSEQLKEEQKEVEGPIEKQPKLKKKKICFDFQKTGSCKFGDKCRFLHELSSTEVSKSSTSVTSDDKVIITDNQSPILQKQEINSESINNNCVNTQSDTQPKEEDNQENKESNSTSDSTTQIDKSRDWGQEYLNLFPSYLRGEGGLICPIESIMKSPSLEGYRNKFEFTIGYNKEKLPSVGFRVGLFKEGSITVESPIDVPFMTKQIKLLSSFIESFIRQSQLPIYDLVSGSGFWRSVLIRESKYSNSLLLCIRYKDNEQNEEIVKNELNTLKMNIINESEKEDAIFKISSFYYQNYEGVSTPSVQDIPEHIYGDLYITEYICNKFFHISPSAFFQVNTKAAEAMYNLVGDWSNTCIDNISTENHQKTLLLDVCCGTGTIGISLSNKVDKVIGIEICESAVLDARANAAENHVDNSEWIASPAEKVLNDLLRRPDIAQYTNIVAVVDPPRGGLHRDVIAALRKYSVVKSIIYISCNPTGSFIDNLCDLCIPATRTYPGIPFKPLRSKPIDLFPYTSHCELVTYFVRQTSEDMI